MESEPQGREVSSVPLNRTARAIIDRIRDDTGVPKTEALSRILEWFTELPLELRLAVLNRNEDARRRLLKTVVDEMAGGPPDSPDVPVNEEGALRIIRRMVARLDAIRAGRAESGDAQKKAKR